MPRPARIVVQCGICAAPLTVKPSRMKQAKEITCSRECLFKLRSRNVSQARRMEGPREATCPTCGKTFERKASQLAKYKTSYCSGACRAIGIRGPRPDLITGCHIPCETCGKPAWRTPATLMAQTFCSMACTKIGKIRPSGPRVARVAKPCATCGFTMRMLPCDAKRYKYCSLRCAARATQGAKRGLPGRAWPAGQRAKLAATLRTKWESEWAYRVPELSARMSGERNHRWRDGRGRKPYAPGFTRRLKYQIAKRDHFRCRRCDALRGKGTHVVHHIDGAKYDHSPENLVLLCKPCHGTVHAEMDRQT